MNTYNYNDNVFKNTDLYKQFIAANPSQGFLKIRAYTASEALPISNMNIVVSKVIDNNKIIFYEGKTNLSGVIEKITLPAPKLNQNNLDAPSSITYDILTTYLEDNFTETYKVNIYENIYVVQTVNVVPTLNVSLGDTRWL